MKINILILLVSIHLLCCADALSQESSRPVVSEYVVGIGRSNALATYLSPIHYTGKTLSVIGSWQKAMPFSPQKAVMHFAASAEWSDLLNPAQTARMIGLLARFDWGMSRRFQLPAQLQITAGATVGFDAGAYYLLRNGNNPVQTIADIKIGLRASVSRPFRIKNLPILLSNTLSLPSLSLFFSPQYGETYYEIYLGNHKGLIHPGWWGNNFRINNMLSAVLDFGRTAMTLGYRYNLYTQYVCNLNTRIFTHSFVIGVIPGGIGLKKSKKKNPEEIISPLY